MTTGLNSTADSISSVVNKALQQFKNIPGIEKVTHVYYTAYAGHGTDHDELKRINSEAIKNAVEACESCCPEMKFFTLQTGGKV